MSCLAPMVAPGVAAYIVVTMVLADHADDFHHVVVGGSQTFELSLA